jgi:hypothetical protein
MRNRAAMSDDKNNPKLKEEIKKAGDAKDKDIKGGGDEGLKEVLDNLNKDDKGDKE